MQSLLQALITVRISNLLKSLKAKLNFGSMAYQISQIKYLNKTQLWMECDEFAIVQNCKDLQKRCLSLTTMFGKIKTSN